MKLTELMEKEYNDITSAELDSISYQSTDGLQKIIKTYDHWLKREEREIDIHGSSWRPSDKKTIERIRNLSKKKQYSREDITTFSTYMQEREQSKAFTHSGYFLSLLINYHYKYTNDQEKYVILTNHLKEKIHRLCYKNNGANVRVLGSVGHGFCSNMKQGTVVLSGNCDKVLAPFMKGGDLTVYGDVDTVETLDSEKNNGIITLLGSCIRISPRIKKGTVYYHGEDVTAWMKKGEYYRPNNSLEERK